MAASTSPQRCRRAAGWLAAAVVGLAAACAGGGPGPSPTQPPQTTTTTAPASTTAPATTTSAAAAIPLRIGVVPAVAYAIPFVLAEEATGIGAANGLAVTVEIFADAAEALAALLDGEVDAAFPDGLSALIALADGHCLRAPLMFLDRDAMRLVGRSDLITANDLIGRKVGTVTGSAGEVALRMWLADEGIPWEEVVVVPTRPEDMPAALAGGLVDAVVWTEPVPGESLAACGEDACRYVGSLGTSYREVVPLSVRCDWARSRGDAGPIALVRAWLEAKEYVRNNPAEAAAITAGRLHLTPGEVADRWEQRAWPAAWPPNLTDGQLAMLEAYGAYLVTSEALAEAPDVCSWVDSRWLEEVAPSRVALEQHSC